MKRERLAKSKKEMIQKLVSMIAFSSFYLSDIKIRVIWQGHIDVCFDDIFHAGRNEKEKKDGKVEKEVTTAFEAILLLSAERKENNCEHCQNQSLECVIVIKY